MAATNATRTAPSRAEVAESSSDDEMMSESAAASSADIGMGTTTTESPRRVIHMARRSDPPVPDEALASIPWMGRSRLARMMTITAQRGPFDQSTWQKYIARADVILPALREYHLAFILNSLAESGHLYPTKGDLKTTKATPMQQGNLKGFIDRALVQLRGVYDESALPDSEATPDAPPEWTGKGAASIARGLYRLNCLDPPSFVLLASVLQRPLPTPAKDPRQPPQPPAFARSGGRRAGKAAGGKHATLVDDLGGKEATLAIHTFTKAYRQTRAANNEASRAVYAGLFALFMRRLGHPDVLKDLTAANAALLLNALAVASTRHLPVARADGGDNQDQTEDHKTPADLPSTQDGNSPPVPSFNRSVTSPSSALQTLLDRLASSGFIEEMNLHSLSLVMDAVAKLCSQAQQQQPQEDVRFVSFCDVVLEEVVDRVRGLQPVERGRRPTDAIHPQSLLMILMACARLHYHGSVATVYGSLLPHATHLMEANKLEPSMLVSLARAVADLHQEGLLAASGGDMLGRLLAALLRAAGRRLGQIELKEIVMLLDSWTRGQFDDALGLYVERSEDKRTHIASAPIKSTDGGLLRRSDFGSPLHELVKRRVVRLMQEKTQAGSSDELIRLHGKVAWCYQQANLSKSDTDDVMRLIHGC
ncbi:unnamed protein product [Vitrella brassicaformis CCMP3155]|uniref:Uncharacterized protein n=2 Tax=Vitrella brassicaformis TaxID=1169539 RepID=A0A0G4FHE1_VITBC|nr:unnamed protein product [Vitrella brassicaformis CCMP3155]|eukprot:CEM12373.1 unnamed protein product [Vitrella brassicaformis CCMP3155]